MMNKKGALVLRNIMFMLIVFSSIMALSSLIIINMAGEYDNDDMISEYQSEGVGDLGNILLKNVTEVMEDSHKNTGNETESLLGSFTSPTGVIQGAGAIFVSILKTPVYVGNAITTMLTALKIPLAISSILGNIISFAIYIVIIFVIISALLKGGKV